MKWTFFYSSPKEKKMNKKKKGGEKKGVCFSSFFLSGENDYTAYENRK